MSALAWALALLLPVALGASLVRCLAPDLPRGLVVALGAALGPALTSLLHVTWLSTFGPPGLAGPAVEVVAIVALTLLTRRRVGAPTPAAPPSSLDRALALVLGLVALACVASFVRSTSPWSGCARGRTLARRRWSRRCWWCSSPRIAWRT